ncbi:class I SAM-dependent methyltransferase [Lapidilactobacillus achengensis]|uniref:Class I SAM-dependent methyltransferase n=1 Tax=Lapidilactobacillus achengensis TaxID=2486000 RepID=A0ABW1UPA6_9LACO|nr:class I SAM-dependent methyltransferase [Lapidilactobacillus achengensis]
MKSDDRAAQQQAWDEFAPDYYAAEQASQIAYVPAVLTYLRQQHLLPPAETALLDLGGGTGRFALPLVQQGQAVTVADFSTAMLTILARRWQHLQTKQANQRWGQLTWRQTSWQELVRQQARYPVVFASMLPEVTPAALRQLASLATQRLLIFRLTAVTDDLFTPLWQQLALPPERPEVDGQLMRSYQTALAQDFATVATKTFDFTTTERLAREDLLAYLQDYPEMTAAKLQTAQRALWPQLRQGSLTITEHYQFTLLVAKRA